MGVTVRQKRSGRGQPWSVFVHANGRIKQKVVGDKKAAEAVASALRRKMKAGELHLDEKPKAPEFGQYVEYYMKRYAEGALKRTTVYSYRTIFDRHLLPAWKGKRLDQITRTDAQRLLNQKQRDGFATGTVENIKALVSGLFTHACDEGVISSNPALRLGRYINKHDRRKEVRPLSREEVARFLATARQHTPDHFPLLLTAFRTGMRMGELLGLAWGDVDFSGNRIRIQRNYTHGDFTTPKSHKSRTVDMSDQLAAVLLQHRATLTRRFGGQLKTIEIPGSRGKM